MPETTFDDKIKLKKTMRDVIVDTWLSSGSPLTIQAVQTQVKEKLNKNHSWHTIKSYMEELEKKGYIESQKFSNNQTFFKPKKEKLQQLKKLTFGEY